MAQKTPKGNWNPKKEISPLMAYSLHFH
uniref:Uncharacterized protein n=1 Tax=Rhizophora mucronata TaxID=61149 RepID=A0A2P2Q176_RHIMU